MYVAISGNIGSGKTTLTEILTKRYGAKAYYEETDNPYIGDFYNDMSRWAFHLQVSFLGSRINQTVEMLSVSDKHVIQDRTIYEDAHIFATNLKEMGLMTHRDYATYMRIFELTTNLIPKPDVLIYLRASIPTLVTQIKRRGREYEMNIDEAYLSRLNDKYEYWINNVYKGKVLTIDMDTEDFILNPSVVDSICERLESMAASKE
jgi:deoxyadenosine/deoxycytidine kinase